jgi:peptidoglycan/xylan/chitin deacetylase (PgdA/CDA1 family)
MYFIRKLFFKTLYNLGLGKLLLKGNRKKGHIPVLVFHKVVPEHDRVWPGIHPKLFEQIIVMLKKHYTILPLSDLLIKDTSTLKNACFITIDDGYLDYLEFAYPILKRHNVPSTVFVLPSDLATLGRVWTSSIIYLVKHYPLDEVRQFLRENGQNMDFGPHELDFAVHHKISMQLCKLTQAERWPMIKALHDKFVADGRNPDRELIGFDELKKLDPSLVSIESHSLTHPSFGNENSEEFIEYEMQHSKELIEKNIGRKVRAFAFPFSKHNPLSMDIVKRHYDKAFTDVQKPVNIHKLREDEAYRYDLPRYNVYHGTAEEVFLLINGFHKNF